MDIGSEFPISIIFWMYVKRKMQKILELFMAKSVTILPTNFSRKIKYFQFMNSIILNWLNSAWKHWCKKTPFSYLNNLYRATESAFQTKNF